MMYGMVVIMVRVFGVEVRMRGVGECMEQSQG